MSTSTNKFDNFKNDQNKYSKEKTNSLNDKLENIIFRNVKGFSMGIIETFNNSIFHFLDTLKVRIQSKSIAEDVSLFYKNRVMDKRI